MVVRHKVETCAEKTRCGLVVLVKVLSDVRLVRASSENWEKVNCRNCRRALVQEGDALYEVCRWTDSCSGCFEGGEYMGLASNYPYDKKAQCHVGAGCSECGYTGKVRREFHAPANRAAEIAMGIPAEE